jgi:hypothetical protein
MIFTRKQDKFCSLMQYYLHLRCKLRVFASIANPAGCRFSYYQKCKEWGGRLRRCKESIGIISIDRNHEVWSISQLTFFVTCSQTIQGISKWMSDICWAVIGAVVRSMFKINISACHLWDRWIDSQSNSLLMWKRGWLSLTGLLGGLRFPPTSITNCPILSIELIMSYM